MPTNDEVPTVDPTEHPDTASHVSHFASAWSAIYMPTVHVPDLVNDQPIPIAVIDTLLDTLLHHKIVAFRVEAAIRLQNVLTKTPFICHVPETPGYPPEEAPPPERLVTEALIESDQLLTPLVADKREVLQAQVLEKIGKALEQSLANDCIVVQLQVLTALRQATINAYNYQLSHVAMDSLIQIIHHGEDEAAAHQLKERAYMLIGFMAQKKYLLPEEVVKALVESLREDDVDLVEIGVEALRDIAKNGQKLPAEAIDLLGSIYDKSLRRKAVRAFAYFTEHHPCMLPIDILNTLSAWIMGEASTELRLLCVHILWNTVHHQNPLHKTRIPALEAALGSADPATMDVAVCSLIHAVQHNQALSKDMLSKIESVFNTLAPEHKEYRRNISRLLYEVYQQVATPVLSASSYATMASVIADETAEGETHQNCYCLLMLGVVNGYCMPDSVFKVVWQSFSDQDNALREEAALVLMCALIEDSVSSRQDPHIHQARLSHVQQALRDPHLKIRAYAACVLGHNIGDDNRPALLVYYLESALQEESITHYAVAALHRTFQTEDYSLLEESRVLLSRFARSTENSMPLRKQALQVIELSLHKHQTALSREVLATVESIVKEDKDLLAVDCLKLLLSHRHYQQGNKTLSPLLMHFIEGSLQKDEDAYSHTSDPESTEQSTAALSISENGLLGQGPTYEFEEDKGLVCQGPPYNEGTAEASVGWALAQQLNCDEKTLDQLLKELQEQNQDNKPLLLLLEEGAFEKQYQAVTEAWQQDSQLFPRDKSIDKWEAQDCAEWADFLREHPDKARDPQFLPEILAVVSQGNVLATTQHHKPRAIQLLTLLIALDAKEQGRLAQVSTGEGKSTIVAMLAVIKVLQGEIVDIVSSSPLLASRDADDKRVFFSIFNMTVADNWDDKEGCRPPPGFKPCYLADVVYGAIENFQWDWLRQICKLEGTRGDRPYGVVLIDEVDSMLVDGVDDHAIIGGETPGMEHLQDLLAAMWVELDILKDPKNFSLKNGKIIWQRGPRGEKFELPERCDRTTFLMYLLEAYGEGLIEREDSPVIIPQHLKHFARSQVHNWARNALVASEQFHEGKDYVKTVDENHHEIIAPVDYLHTGIIHPNTAWHDGLHQFLQLKHKLKMTRENLSDCFISNRGYFTLYGEKIYGLTGTLGCPETKNLLRKAYPLDVVTIPTYKPKRFTKKPGIVLEAREVWLAEIVASVEQELKKKRAALVICECINVVKEIEKAFHQSGVSVTRYSRSDNDENLVTSEEVDSGKVIVATNLAGRGTDFKISPAVEARGGLFVCVTFLPPNKRVGDQADGRAARNGEQGSAQLVIYKTDAEAQLLSQSNYVGSSDTIEQLEAWRDRIEKARLNAVQNEVLEKIITKDELFKRCCEFLNTLRAIDDNPHKIGDVANRWGFWLKKVENTLFKNKPFDKAAVLSEFERFQKELSAAFSSGDMQDVGHLVQQGNRLAYGVLKDNNCRINQYNKKVDNYKEAVAQYRAQMLQYNEAVRQHNERVKQYETAAQQHQAKIQQHNAVVQQHNVRMRQYNEKVRQYDADMQRYSEWRRQHPFKIIIFDSNVAGDFPDYHDSNPYSIGLNRGRFTHMRNTNPDPIAVAYNAHGPEIIAALKTANAGEDAMPAVRAVLARLPTYGGPPRPEPVTVSPPTLSEGAPAPFSHPLPPAFTHPNPAPFTVQPPQLELVNYAAAIAVYKKAMALDPVFAVQAHYNCARVRILERAENYKQDAAQDLAAAQALIEETLIPHLYKRQVVLGRVHAVEETGQDDLVKQITTKIALLDRQCQHIAKAKDFLEKAEGDVRIRSSTALASFFDAGNVPNREIYELNQSGLEQLFEVEEEPDDDDDNLFGFFATVFVGVIQLTIGACLITAGHVYWGAVCIAEGFGDIFSACIELAGGDEITLKGYFTAKIPSLVFTMVTIGIETAAARAKQLAEKEALKQVAKKEAVKTVVKKEVAKKVVEQEAAKKITKAMFRKAVTTHVGPALRNAAIKQTVNFATDHLTKQALSGFKSDIRESVRGTLVTYFNTPDFKRRIDKILATDTSTTSFTQRNKVNKLAFDIVNPAQDHLAGITHSLFTGIIAHQHLGIAAVITLAELPEAISNIKVLSKRFCQEFSERLQFVEDQLPQIGTLLEGLLSKSKELTPTAVREIMRQLKRQHILNADNTRGAKFATLGSETLFLGEYQPFAEAVINTCKALQAALTADQTAAREKLYESLIEMVTQCIMSHLYTDIAKPVAGSMMNHQLNKLAHHLYESGRAPPPATEVPDERPFDRRSPEEKARAMGQKLPGPPPPFPRSPHTITLNAKGQVELRSQMGNLVVTYTSSAPNVRTPVNLKALLPGHFDGREAVKAMQAMTDYREACVNGVLRWAHSVGHALKAAGSALVDAAIVAGPSHPGMTEIDRAQWHQEMRQTAVYQNAEQRTGSRINTAYTIAEFLGDVALLATPHPNGEFATMAERAAWQAHLRQLPPVKEAHQRMDSKRQIVQQAWAYFQKASGPQQTEIMLALGLHVLDGNIVTEAVRVLETVPAISFHRPNPMLYDPRTDFPGVWRMNAVFKEGKWWAGGAPPGPALLEGSLPSAVATRVPHPSPHSGAPNTTPWLPACFPPPMNTPLLDTSALANAVGLGGTVSSRVGLGPTEAHVLGQGLTYDIPLLSHTSSAYAIDLVDHMPIEASSPVAITRPAKTLFKPVAAEGEFLFVRPRPVFELGQLSDASGAFDFVVMNNGELRAYPETTVGHFDAAEGDEIETAGVIHLEKGKVTSWLLHSGHFKPEGQAAKDRAIDAFKTAYGWDIAGSYVALPRAALTRKDDLFTTLFNGLNYLSAVAVRHDNATRARLRQELLLALKEDDGEYLGMLFKYGGIPRAFKKVPRITIEGIQSEKRSGEFIYAVTQEGEEGTLLLAKKSEAYTHADLLQGEPGRAFGSVTFKKGVLKKLDNEAPEYPTEGIRSPYIALKWFARYADVRGKYTDVNQDPRVAQFVALVDKANDGTQRVVTHLYPETRPAALPFWFGTYVRDEVIGAHVQRRLAQQMRPLPGLVELASQQLAALISTHGDDSVGAARLRGHRHQNQREFPPKLTLVPCAAQALGPLEEAYRLEAFAAVMHDFDPDKKSHVRAAKKYLSLLKPHSTPLKECPYDIARPYYVEHTWIDGGFIGPRYRKMTFELLNPNTATSELKCTEWSSQISQAPQKTWGEGERQATARYAVLTKEKEIFVFLLHINALPNSQIGDRTETHGTLFQFLNFCQLLAKKTGSEKLFLQLYPQNKRLGELMRLKYRACPAQPYDDNWLDVPCLTLEIPLAHPELSCIERYGRSLAKAVLSMVLVFYSSPVEAIPEMAADLEWARRQMREQLSTPQDSNTSHFSEVSRPIASHMTDDTMPLWREIVNDDPSQSLKGYEPCQMFDLGALYAQIATRRIGEYIYVINANDEVLMAPMRDDRGHLQLHKGLVPKGALIKAAGTARTNIHGKVRFSNYTGTFKVGGPRLGSYVLRRIQETYGLTNTEFTYYPGSEILDPDHLPKNVVLPSSPWYPKRIPVEVTSRGANAFFKAAPASGHGQPPTFINS